ncbi:hypothetical protein [Cupriavidus sp. a3]|uniref:hypothetical protein n=1 Tax=Cupriavidus sp. a3 TaxID=3242158 RepID=UPI003D9C53CB
MPTFHKRDIARIQLETAVDTFLRGLCYHAVITLAGAASGILDGLLRAEADKEAFVDYARRVHEGLQGQTPSRDSYFHHIEQFLGISAHKHLSETDSETVELDLYELAEKALTRAIIDYVNLNERAEPTMNAFMRLLWLKNEGPRMMEAYKDVPARMRPRR